MQYGSVLGNLYQEAAFQRVRYTYETAEFIMTDPQAFSLFVDYSKDYIYNNPAYVSGRFLTGGALSVYSKAPFIVPATSAYGDIQHNAQLIQNFAKEFWIGN